MNTVQTATQHLVHSVQRRKVFNGGIIRYGGKNYTFWDSINCKGESVLVYVDRFNTPLYAQLFCSTQPLALSEVAR